MGILRPDGTFRAKIIAAGLGSKAYYPADMLKRDLSAFKQGTHVYVNHPTDIEAKQRPERDLRDLAAVQVSPAEWNEADQSVYAEFKALDHYKAFIEAVAGDTGMSIRADGTVKVGKVNGMPMKICEGINQVLSVDLVTRAGAGGGAVKLFESARGGLSQDQIDEINQQFILQENSVNEIKELTEKIAALEESLNSMTAENTALKESNISIMGERDATAALYATAQENIKTIREANSKMLADRVLTETLNGLTMPALMRQKMVESFCGNFVVDENGTLNEAAYKTAITAKVHAELEYITALTGHKIDTTLGESVHTHSHNPSSVSVSADIDAAFENLLN